jgi:hypothetical protein
VQNPKKLGVVLKNRTPIPIGFTYLKMPPNREEKKQCKLKLNLCILGNGIPIVGNS